MFDDLTPGEVRETALLVSFFDLAGFARYAGDCEAREVFDVCAGFFDLTGGISEDGGGRLIKAIGDAGLAAFEDAGGRRMVPFARLAIRSHRQSALWPCRVRLGRRAARQARRYLRRYRQHRSEGRCLRTRLCDDAPGLPEAAAGNPDAVQKTHPASDLHPGGAAALEIATAAVVSSFHGMAHALLFADRAARCGHARNTYL